MGRIRTPQPCVLFRRFLPDILPQRAHLANTVSYILYINTGDLQIYRIRPDQTRPDQTRPDQTRPDQTRPDQTRPDQTRPDQTRPDQARPDQTRPDQTRPDQTRPDQTRPDQTRPDQTRPDQTRPDQSPTLRNKTSYDSRYDPCYEPRYNPRYVRPDPTLSLTLTVTPTLTLTHRMHPTACIPPHRSHPAPKPMMDSLRHSRRPHMYACCDSVRLVCGRRGR